MYSPTIDIHDIDEGVDRKQLTQLKQRFLQLNAQRHARTCAALTERQQQFLQLLPLLFHVNHPMLPGYISTNTPAGIYQYSPNDEELRLAKKLARSFQYNVDLTEKKAAIDALFVMGSVGTIAQSDSSDLDIWVCHSIEPNPILLTELEQKCQLISQWAADQIHVEVHFFLMRSDDFSSQLNQTLSSEGSGSAQHFLLLDEFYRTALWLAGKHPLWWFIPASQEHNYASYRDKLLGKRFLKQEDVIDFGGLPEIPANEFIGAGIWHLYKAIESPYKSVLKLLLLEAYANNQITEQAAGDHSRGNQLPSEPLALIFKRALYAQEPDANALDPYVMVYRHLEQYLQTHQQPDRLDLVRRCFYFKVNKPLSRMQDQRKKPWQAELLTTLVNEWRWPSHQLHMLDNRTLWKAPQVIEERAILVNELNRSYRLLSELHRHQHQNTAISNDDINTLGRKLHAAFERKAGKIEWINPGISYDLSEDNLCIVKQANERGENWQVLRGSQSELALRTAAKEPIKRSRSLMELLLWCHANEILLVHTKVDIIGEAVSLSASQTRQLVHAIQQWLPLPLTTNHEQFSRSATIEKILIVVNTGVEPQGDLHKKGMQMLSKHNDALGYSGLRENLMVCADIIQLNSWGELVCRHYAVDALLNCLHHYFRLFPPGRQVKLPELEIRCFSSGQGNNIALRLTELWRDLIHCYYCEPHSSNRRYLLEVGGDYFLIQFLQQQFHIHRFQQYETLLETLSHAQPEFSQLVIDRHALRDKPLSIIGQHIQQPGISVFYQLEHGRAHITIVDRNGSIFSTTVEYHNQQTLLRPLVYFIHTTVRRELYDGNRTAAPPNANDISIFELVGNIQQQQGRAEPRPLQSDARQLHFINIKAIAEMDEEQQLRFTIYCNEQEFSELVYGDNCFTAVARYIMACRKHGERYPCYITDLDLSLCHNSSPQPTRLHLSHYLQLKAELESKLNAALIAL